MKLLIAEDESISLRLLTSRLRNWGYEVIATQNGRDALAELQQEDGAQIAILDWMMPEMDGPEVCRRVREMNSTRARYLILLTTRSTEADLVAGLEAGADDYLTKPFRSGELRARIRVGERMVAAENALANRVRDLEHALAEVDLLRGLLPICTYCKKIRDGGDYWHQLESYLSRHSELRFSHGICPECYTHAVEQLKESP